MSNFLGEEGLKKLISLIKQKIAGKQDTLTAGDNIKIENNVISATGGGSGVTVDDELSTTSENPVQNKVITAALNGKASSDDLNTLETNIENSLDSETTARKEADADLQKQITSNDNDIANLQSEKLDSDDVTYTASVTSGTKLGTLKVGDTETDVYAPSGGSGGSTYTSVSNNLEIDNTNFTMDVYTPLNTVTGIFSTIELTAGEFKVVETVISKDVVVNLGDATSGHLAEYMLQIITDEGSSHSITFPDTVKMSEEDTTECAALESNCIYQFSIVNNVLRMCCVPA